MRALCRPSLAHVSADGYRIAGLYSVESKREGNLRVDGGAWTDRSGSDEMGCVV